MPSPFDAFAGTRGSLSEKRFGSLIGIAARQWRRRVDLRLQAYGLSDATWLPLLRLAQAGRPLRQKELAAALFLDSSSVVRIVGHLEETGLIARQEDEEDRRARRISLTPAGQELVGRVERASQDIEAEVLAGLAPQDLDAARRVLVHICSALTQPDAAKDGLERPA